MSEPGLRAALSLSAARRLALSCAGSALAAASPGAVRGPNWLRVPPLCDLEAAELDQKRPGKDQEDDRVGNTVQSWRVQEIFGVHCPSHPCSQKILRPAPNPMPGKVAEARSASPHGVWV